MGQRQCCPNDIVYIEIRRFDVDMNDPKGRNEIKCYTVFKVVLGETTIGELINGVIPPLHDKQIQRVLFIQDPRNGLCKESLPLDTKVMTIAKMHRRVLRLRLRIHVTYALAPPSINVVIAPPTQLIPWSLLISV